MHLVQMACFMIHFLRFGNNAEMRDFVNNTDNTYLIDWYAASEGHPEYFADDETHLNKTGAKAFVECIREAMLETYRSQE